MDAKPKSNKLKRLEKKQRLQRRAEREQSRNPRDEAALLRTRADVALREGRVLARDPGRLVDAVLGARPVRVPQTSALSHLSRALEAGRSRPPAERHPRPVDLVALRGLVLLCHERGNLLEGVDAPRFIAALVALSAHADRWVRAPETWVANSHNAWRQFRSLLRHLTSVYDVPAFMDSAWTEGLTATGGLHQGWYLHVAQGQNIRTAGGLPVPLTKRQAHLYLQAPHDFDILSGFRWAQILELGGDERLVRSVLATRAARDFAHDEFWLTVFRWLVGLPMLDPAHHGPIVDYLYHQRYEPTVPNPDVGAPGAPRLVPAQPNLSMKGRNPETLLRAVTAWHRRLGREQAAEGTTWAPSDLPSLELEEGKGDNRRVFVIHELTTARALSEEGKAMGHCVGSYTRSCASGRVSIWSLGVRDELGRSTRLLTLEVVNNDRQIVQARRRFNELPGPREYQILRRWADVGGPKLSKWLSG